MLSKYHFHFKNVLHLGYSIVSNVKCLTDKSSSNPSRRENAFYVML